MTELLARHQFRVSISYGHFAVQDRCCDTAESPAASAGTVVAASAYRLEAYPHSRCAAVALTVRVWAAEPAVDAAEWEEHERLALHCPTGEMVVEQIAAGPAGEFSWASGAGVYGLHVYWRGGPAAQLAETEIFLRNRDTPIGDLTARLRTLDGTEQFLVDAWREGPAGAAG